MGDLHAISKLRESISGTGVGHFYRRVCFLYLCSEQLRYVQYDMLLAVSAVGSWSSGVFSAMSGVNHHCPEPYILRIDLHKTERQQQNH